MGKDFKILFFASVLYYICVTVTCVFCVFKVAEAHVPSYIFDEFRTIL